MNILFFTTTHNELSQRAHMELVERGHSVTVQLANSDADMIAATAHYQPQLIIAPFLKKAIPAAISQKYTVLTMRAGALADRGPVSPKGALAEDVQNWRITITQPSKEKVTKDILAAPALQVRPGQSSPYYRHHVAQATVQSILEAVEKLEKKAASRQTPLYAHNTQLRGRLHSLGL